MKKKLISSLLILTVCFSIFAQEKLDALVLYRNGRNLESQGNTAAAKEAFKKSVAVCNKELESKPGNIDSYVVLTWSLLRLEDYKTTIAECQKALKIKNPEYRIIETLAEANFYLKNYTESMKYFEQYVNGTSEKAERLPTAYFFMGEIFRIQKKYEHADIAYSTALQREPNMPLWWYRLGLVRESNGNKTGAKTAYQSALRYNQNYTAASEGLKRVS